MVTKICKYCGKEFTTKYNAKVYCNENCAKNFYFFGAKQTEFECKYCGKTFTSDRKKKYCSVQCQSRANYRRKVSQKNKKNKPKVSIEEVAKKSKEMHVTAGEYMAKYCYGRENK